MTKRLQTIKIVTTAERIEAYERNKLIGFVQDDTLFTINSNGYSENIGSVNHRSEIAGKLIAYSAKQR